MESPRRFSTLSVFFLGACLLGTTGIISGTFVILYAMRIAERNATQILGIADNTVANLPEIVASLPPALAQVLNDRRAPEYASNLDVSIQFIPSRGGAGVVPALTVTNKGREVVTLLTLSVAAIDAAKTPRATWVDVLATPLAFNDDWRGPLMPGATRYAVLSGSINAASASIDSLTGVVEITDVRIWNGAADPVSQ